jgi:DNA-binding transcriptional LysR family regulator
MRHRTLDLRTLQSFTTIVSARSFTAAAEHLNYSQSTVSMQIKRLEAELGIAVLTHEAGIVRPTRAGLEVLGYAREMLRLDAELRNKLARREVAGTVRLGLPVDYAPYIPGTLTLFAERYPRVELAVRSEFSVTLIEQARAGEIDMAIVTRELDAPGGVRLRREPLVWVAAPGASVQLQEPLPLAISPEGICAFRAAATTRLDAVGRRWRTAYEGQAFATQRVPVEAGLAVTVAIPSLVGTNLEILDSDTAGLPELPMIDIRLHRSPGRASQPATYLADLIVERVRDNRNVVD